MRKDQILGSETAKNGFKNEDDIVHKFNNWESDEDAQRWFTIMAYKLDKIEYVKAVKLNGYKTDVQVQVTVKLKSVIDAQNIQVKLVSNFKGFNQIDKRWVDKYVDMWNINHKISKLLKLYTGEIEPCISNPIDQRRMFAHEFSKVEQQNILEWLRQHQSLIVADILKGRGKFSAEWMLVVQKVDENARWILKPMNFCLNYFGNGAVAITKQGNFKLGKITMQRKGGDNGRETSKMLQFKINPAELFNQE
ncbi:MAG: hypothetical protein QM528_01360 [Phycisphaerales bacterium]|nr:hypothetical protein [Phycisphaerales bacterium]